jgi:predicted Zn-dependent protease
MRNMLLISLLAAACATNPATGKSEISLVSESQEIEMGKQGAQETLASMPLVADSNVQRYVRRVAMELVGVAERPNLPWNFYVLDDAAVNAFAYPGGFIFITRGILTHMNSEAELAGVLGHEIGHVTARHTASQMTKQQLAQIGLVAGSVLSSTVASMAGAASQGLGMLFMKFGRDAEYQADELGFRYMTKDGYDPRAMSSMFQMLQRQSAMGGQGRLPEWQSTHPDPENRVAKNDQRVGTFQASTGTLKVNRDPFLQVIDGLTFGEDPRQGYFENNVFYHPNFKLKFTFPQGWKTQNLPASVIGASPEQDAVVRLGIGKGSPQQALQQFMGQQGIQAGRASTNPINGLPAATSEFSAQTEQGQVSGIISYVQHSGQTFQVLAYTTAQKYQGYVNSLLGSVQSMSQLTEASKLNVQPVRIDIVKISKDMTIDAFNRDYPSRLPLEYVAIINGVEPGALLKAGTSVKQVK